MKQQGLARHLTSERHKYSSICRQQSMDPIKNTCVKEGHNDHERQLTFEGHTRTSFVSLLQLLLNFIVERPKTKEKQGRQRRKRIKHTEHTQTQTHHRPRIHSLHYTAAAVSAAVHLLLLRTAAQTRSPTAVRRGHSSLVSSRPYMCTIHIIQVCNTAVQQTVIIHSRHHIRVPCHDRHDDIKPYHTSAFASEDARPAMFSSSLSLLSETEPTPPPENDPKLLICRSLVINLALRASTIPFVGPRIAVGSTPDATLALVGAAPT